MPSIITLGLFVTVLVVDSTTQIVMGATPSPVAVTTYHYDNLRTGWNQHETTLTASRAVSERTESILDSRIG